MRRKVKIIMGPTASGKSKMALRYGGTIINADSQQVYSDIPIVTSQPTEMDKSLAKHELYGFLKHNEQINAAKWCEMAAKIVEKSIEDEKIPVIVGGTGMYIKCLTEGISKLPVVPKEVRKEVSDLASTNYEKLCEIVYKNDESLRKTITSDKHRQMVRAYEILLTSGKSIGFFFAQPKIQFLKDIECETTIIKVERQELYKRINERCEKMLKNGAIEEVKSLLRKTDQRRDYPIFKAIGVSEICSYIDEKSTLEETFEKVSRNTRRYAKRQITWIHGMKLYNPSPI
ncbi:MAG: tRNA (adenosine(37)-N6)-dimethylallyltransferase MiaA [Holosporales bacterium]|nr:tRNA (adenosine(37)-N6)-dimethylallyltransferase MiaA [Holosporales bacterium]